MGSKKAVSALIRSLREDSGPVRIAAIEALYMIRVPELLSLLIPLVEDLDDDMRTVVAETLGRIEDGQAVKALEKMTSDHNLKVRRSAIRSLGWNAPME